MVRPMKRREFVIKSSMVGTAMMLSPATRAEGVRSWPRYQGATVIDALGEPGNGSISLETPKNWVEFLLGKGISSLNS